MALRNGPLGATTVAFVVLLVRSWLAMGMYPHVPFTELVHSADLIFVGTVRGSACRLGPDKQMIFTDVVFDAVQVIHKRTDVAGPQETLTLTFAGGEIGDQSVQVSDVPALSASQTYLIFALVNGGPYAIPVVAGADGVFPIMSDAVTGKQYPVTLGRSAVTGVVSGELQFTARIDHLKNGIVKAAPLRPLIPPPQSSDSAGRAQSLDAAASVPALSLEALRGEIHRILAGPSPNKPVLRGLCTSPVPQTKPHLPSKIADAQTPGSLPAIMPAVPEAVLLPLRREGPGMSLESNGLPSANPAVVSNEHAESLNAGTPLCYCGYFNLPLVMEVVGTDSWAYDDNMNAMWQYNQSMDVYRYRPSDGSFGDNSQSEFCGFLDDATLYSTYGFHWGGALGVARTTAIGGTCGRIIEADVAFNAAYEWAEELSDTLGNPYVHLYRTTVMHELGHTWGMQRTGPSSPCAETYSYNQPSVMQSESYQTVEDGWGIHAGDAWAIRDLYDDQTAIIPVKDVGVESYAASSGLINGSTDKSSYMVGESVTVRNISVENMSSSSTADVRLRLYLSTDNWIDDLDYQMGGYWYWTTLDREAYWMGSLTTTIPDVPPGTYYVGALVTPDGFGYDDMPFNDSTFCYSTIQVSRASRAYHVSPSGSDANDGRSWPTSKRTIQAGLNAALPGDQVWVAAGTYVENITLPLGVALYGGFAGTETALAQRDWATNATILDGNHAGSVVIAAPGATQTTRIDGFTIRNGKADYGGGISCWASSPTIANDRITGNDGTMYGGGIFCYDSSSPRITGNTIVGNTASNGWGAGICCHWNSAPAIVGNLIAGNSTPWSGAGISCCYASSPLIADNAIAGNQATGTGGGIHCYSDSSPIAADNTIAGNSASTGGGVFSDASSPTISNSIIAFNSSGIYRENTTGTLATRYNCVYGNTAYNFSGLADPTGTDGNISADPLFVAASPGADGIWGTADDDCSDLRLLPWSPCIDTGNNADVPADVADLDGDGNTIEPLPVDVAGRPRFLDDPLMANTGAGTPPIVDMGAYEHRPPVHVSTGGDDANDGFSWATAKRTVQGGIDSAWSGDQVWVRAGQYIETITLRSGVGLYGGFAGGETDVTQRNWTVYQTTIDGNQVGTVVTIASSAVSSTRIDGFTIRNGRVSSYAGGISCGADASPVITNNTITGNVVDALFLGGGGGIYCGPSSSPTIVNNAIVNNSMSMSSGGISGGCSGGGIYCDAGSYPLIADNTIEGNNSANGDLAHGGGIYCWNSSAMITGNVIRGNSAFGSGGGICCEGDSALTIINNTITGNSASYYGGGGICLWGASPTIANNTIAGNSSPYGGGLYLEWGASPIITNSTIAANEALYYGGGFYLWDASPTLANSILAFNSSGFCQTGMNNAPTLRANCVFGNTAYNFSGLTDPTGTEGNISADPRFVSAGPGTDGTWGTADDTYDNLRLLPGSACIDAGNNAFVPADTADLDGDGNAMEPLPIDLAGAPRFADDAYAPDAGGGTPPIVDMGTYEHRCGDVDGDGLIDVVDLLWMVEAFGTYQSDTAFDARCDFNADGAVDVVDLLDVVYNFGT